METPSIEYKLIQAVWNPIVTDSLLASKELLRSAI